VPNIRYLYSWDSNAFSALVETRVAESVGGLGGVSVSHFFCLSPTPGVKFDHFLHHSLSWEFLLKRYNFF